MTETITLHRLVKRAINHKLPFKTFSLYYNQLEKTAPIEENEYLTYLLTLADPKLLNQHKSNEYQSSIVLSQALSSTEHLSRFLQNLAKISEDEQILYLTKMARLVTNKLEPEIVKALISHFQDYSLHAIANSSLKVCTHVVFFCIKIIDEQIPDIQELIFHLLKALKKYENLAQLLQEKSRDLTLDHIDVKVVQKELHAFKKPTLSKEKMDSLSNIKQYLWLNKMMKEWRFEPKIFSNFILNFISGNDEDGNSRSKNPYITAKEFATALLSGYETAVHNKEAPYVLFNWKNYIVSRFPPILALMNINEQEFERLIHDIKPDQDTTIHQMFVKSCIHYKVPMFQKLYPTVIDNALHYETFHQDVLQKFNEQLLTINSEFISLEESGFVEYTSTLPAIVEPLSDLQVELTTIFDKVLDDLISSKDYEKLNRLLLTVLNNGELLMYLVFNDGPFVILYKLIDFIDRELFDLDDDDETFSDFYSYFGVILLGILMIIEKFQIDLKNLMIQNSFIIGYINDFYYRLCDDFVNEVEEKSNLDNLLSDWIISLFDDANDGLSDDLIKSINVRQIYRLIPIIYKQSIIAGKLGIIDFPVLTNGIDYLSQIFLVPCSLSIINWLLKEIAKVQNGKESENEASKTTQFLINVLHEIIKSNINELNEVSLIFKIVLNVCGRNFLHTFRNLEVNDTVKEVLEIVNRNLHDVTTYASTSPVDQVKAMATSPRKCTSFLLDFLRNNPLKLVQYLLNEAVLDEKMSTNLLVYLMILNSTNSNDEKIYWYNHFSAKPEKKDVPEILSKETEFSLASNYHFSSLFENESNSMPDQDYMMDDDLFNEKPKVAGTSEKVKSFLDRVNRIEGSLKEFDEIRAWEYFNEAGTEYKLILGLNELVVEELARLCI